MQNVLDWFSRIGFPGKTPLILLGSALKLDARDIMSAQYKVLVLFSLFIQPSTSILTNSVDRFISTRPTAILPSSTTVHQVSRATTKTRTEIVGIKMRRRYCRTNLSTIE